MLVLTRKVGERIRIGDEIVVTIVRIQNDKVRVGVEAPKHVAVHREEVAVEIEAQGRSITTSSGALPRTGPAVSPRHTT
jgi:carbon storage regulator